MKSDPQVMIRVDRTRPLTEQPRIGHNRWHPHIPPIAEVDPGVIVGIETIDALDRQVLPHHTADDETRYSPLRVHPLTGPLHVRGAQPGDILTIEILDILPDARGYTSHGPFYGFLMNEFPNSALVVHWNLADGFATSPQLPGIRIPACCHVGVMGVAPSLELLREVNRRETSWHAQKAQVNLSTPDDAVPNNPDLAREAWRTIPPREIGGNLDIKQLGKGATLLLPVYVDGALFSLGDAHFAQGDGEVCGTAIEMNATVYVRFGLLKGLARQRNIRDPQLTRELADSALPRRYFATTGQCHGHHGLSAAENLNIAAKNALLNMIDHLVHEKGLTRQQAYIICSVAVDLKISQLVDVPNYLVSAFLPLDIFV